MSGVLSVFTWLFNWLVANIFEFIVGCITGILTTIAVRVIYNLLPIDPWLRFKIGYRKRQAVKWLRNERIGLEYILKASIREEISDSEDVLSNEICSRLSSKGFKCVDKRQGILKFTYQISGSHIEACFSFGYEDIEEDFQRISTIETVLSTTCRYRSFEADMIDLLQVVRRLEDALRDLVCLWHGEAIRCALSHLYNFTGVLSGLKMTHLWGEIEGKYKVDLFEGGIIIYAPLSKEVAAILKRIITFYY